MKSGGVHRDGAVVVVVVSPSSVILTPQDGRKNFTRRELLFSRKRRETGTRIVSVKQRRSPRLFYHIATISRGDHYLRNDYAAEWQRAAPYAKRVPVSKS